MKLWGGYPNMLFENMTTLNGNLKNYTLKSGRRITFAHMLYY